MSETKSVGIMSEKISKEIGNSASNCANENNEKKKINKILCEKFWVHAAEIHRYTITRSAVGQPLKSWGMIKKGMACYIGALSGDELIAAQKAGYIAKFRMYCAKDVDVKIGDRVVCNATIFEISFINKQIGTHLQIDLKAVE
jgi:head-tail adaptor